MVSVITEKLGQQTLNDSVDCDHRQQPVDILCSSNSLYSSFNESASSENNSAPSDFHVKCSNAAFEDDNCVGRNEKQCSCDILPPKRHRHAHSSDVSGQRAGADPPTDSYETKTSSGAATWRPTVRSSSVWRSVAGHALKQTSGRTIAVPADLSPLPVRQSMSSERSTPSESPSPRPASASSGFFDSSQGSLNCNVGEGYNNGMMFSYTFAQSYREALEERISNDTNNSLLDATTVASSESLPMICGPGCGRGTPPVSPFNTETLLPVRCRSQPTVLARNRRDRTRAMGKKRRWPVCDDHRPKLDFLKMKETAYDKTSRSRLRNSHVHHVQFAPDTNCIAPESAGNDVYSWSQPCNSAGDCPKPLSARDVADNIVQCRLSLDSCSSDTCEDQSDVMAFSSEINSKFLRVGGEEGIEEEGEEVFNVDLDNDLDIDQIEKD